MWLIGRPIAVLSVLLLLTVGQPVIGAEVGCPDRSDATQAHPSVLVDGYLVRAGEDTVGQTDLSIRRYPWSAWSSPLEQHHTIDNVTILYEVRDSSIDPQNFIFFRLENAAVQGSVVLRDRDGTTVMNIFRPISIDRQQTTRVKYFREQCILDVFQDVIGIAATWKS